jgi:hypothetical protein
MKKIANRLIRQIISDYESIDNFLDEYKLHKSVIESLKGGDQDTYAAVLSLVYGKDVSWRTMENPVGLKYNSIISVSDGIYTIDLVSHGIREIDKGSMNINQVECTIYLEKDFVKELAKNI